MSVCVCALSAPSPLSPSCLPSFSPHLSVGFFFSMSHLPPAARFPPPPSTPRQQHTQRQHTSHTQRSHTPRQHTQRSSSLHTETTRTETTHRDNTHRDNTHRDDTDRDHTHRDHTHQNSWQAQHFVNLHAPLEAVGVALSAVVCGCRRWSPVRPSIVIRVFTCLLTCRIRGRRSTL